MRNLLPLAVTALVVALCPSLAAAQDLAVDLRTDHAPGSEFSRVRVELVDRADERRNWVTYQTVSSSVGAVSGVRIAEFENVRAGNYILSVQLLDGLLRPVNGRLWYFRASGRDTMTTTLLARP